MSKAFSLRAAVVAVFAASGAGMALQDNQPPTGGTPRIELSTNEWNFGEVWQGEPLKTDVTVRNTGGAPLMIVEVKSDCGCTVPTQPKSPLAPGESSTFSITYDGVKRRGAAHQRVTIVSNDPTQPATVVAIRGTVRPVYDIEPAADGLSFGKIYRDADLTRSCQVANLYTEKMSMRLKEGQDFGSYEIKLREVEAGQRYELSARTRPPLAVGTVRTTVTLLTGLERLPEIQVLVYSNVEPPVSVYPLRLFLPRNSVREIPQVLRVSFAPKQAVHIVGAKATHDSIRVEVRERRDADPGSEGWVQEIGVTLPPGDQIPAGFEPAVEIETDSPDEAYHKVVVPIRMIAPRVTTQPGVAGPTPGVEPAPSPKP